jgi:tetratricopeptide (TPR) repeat protein
MDVEDLVAGSHVAYLNQEYEASLALAEQVKRIAPKDPRGYKGAADALASLGRNDEAITDYRRAVTYDPFNGNRHYELGFALATNSEKAEALKHFAMAEEYGCSAENTIRLYCALAVFCFDIGRYRDALGNLERAEQLAGYDLDILERKAVIYAILDDIDNGIATAERIKLAAPSQYRGYQIAFKLMLQVSDFEAAEKELKKAYENVIPNMDFYEDCIALEISRFGEDNNKDHLYTALSYITEALKTTRPTVMQVIESYINAAELHLQCENREKALECLAAAQDPVGAYNNSFKVTLVENGSVLMLWQTVQNKDTAIRQKPTDNLDGLKSKKRLSTGYCTDSGEPENGFSYHKETIQGFLTKLEGIQENDIFEYRLEGVPQVPLLPEMIDQINRLYIGIYTLKKEFSKALSHARKLQASENRQNAHIGRYTAANALMAWGSPEATKEYGSAIRYFKDAMIQDPADFSAVVFLVQCHMDTGDYREAEELCSIMPKEMRGPLMEKIAETRRIKRKS